MTGSWGWDLLIALAIALLVAWLVLTAALAAAAPRGGLLREALRLLPDVLRLVRRLAADPELPHGVRVRLALLLAYLAFPIDVVPDFIPVLGYADDAIIVVLVLRSVVRRAGVDAVRRHWPGTDDGFAVLVRLCGLVDYRAQGRQSFYALTRPELMDLLAAAETLLAATGHAVTLCPVSGPADESGAVEAVR
ncbi:YkvA family protein [Planomonospora corallina]